MNTALREGIHWVGCVDWTVRDFHGYQTDRGSSYNAYLVLDEKPALIDTVKEAFADECLAHVRVHAPTDRIAYVVCNHAEPDHSGGLPRVMDACPNAELVCDAKCRDTLARHYDTRGWRFRLVKTGDALSLGRRTLTFLETPMVHWPESMFTYVPEERLLFSMDAFGQHYASARRFDDEEPIETLMQEAKTYYANIVMLYARPIAAVLEKARDLAIETIAPSHGVIWRAHVPRILAAYRDWVAHRCIPKVLVIYDTMWKSTERMAKSIAEGAMEQGDVEVQVHHVRQSNHTAIVTEVLDAAALAVGSPTLNKTLMPQVAAALTYLKGLAPGRKAALAFGSYGWARGGAQAVEQYLKDMQLDVFREPIQCPFVPDAKVLEECRAAGAQLAERARQIGQVAQP
jgi:flavorubredoxin